MNLLENEKVYCPICNDKVPMTQITYKHLNKHNLTIPEFKEQYFGYYLIHPELEKRTKEARLVGKRAKDKLIIEKPCWNYENCGNDKVLVNINVPKMNVTCNECRSKNLFHPEFLKNKKLLSGRAIAMNKDENIIKKRTDTLNNRSAKEIEEWRIKREKTLLEKDGKDWKQIQLEKTKSGMKELYGKEYAFQIEEMREQASQTLFERRGVTNIMQEPEVVKLIFSKRDQDKITEKTIKTNIEKYDGPSPMCSTIIQDKANTTRLKTIEPRIKKYLEHLDLEILDEYKDCYEYYNFKCLKCNNIFSSNWNQIQQGRLCPQCSIKKFKPSKAEDEICLFLESIGIYNIYKNDRNLIKPYEIDIILPDYKICIEHSGLFTHSDEVLNKTRKKRFDLRFYHSYKLEECFKKGFRLLTIFEDEWIFKTDIVKARLRQILNKNTNERIHARKCEIDEVTHNGKKEFLNNFHLQGNDYSVLNLGAFIDDKLIAVMTFSHGSISKGKLHGNEIWELSRFCTDYNYRIPGIASKLLSHFKNNYLWNEIYSFADRRWSLGGLYNKLGFALVSDPEKINPNYWYVDCNKLKRIHRFGLRKKSDEPKDISEQVLRISQGYKILYDCGNLKFSLINK